MACRQARRPPRRAPAVEAYAVRPPEGPITIRDDLERTLHSELPITQDLGVRVHHVEPDRVILTAPLETNRNHAGTAFAGSVNAVATLAGWSWVWLLLRRHRIEAQVLIQDSRISYSRPVTSDFRATCETPSEAVLHRFLAMLQRSGRGRIHLDVQVSDRTGTAVSFAGRYVAVTSTPAPAAPLPEEHP
jgi:thioesterase domain-containing protein